MNQSLIPARVLLLLALATAAPAVPYRLGLDGGWAGNLATATRVGWLSEVGARFVPVTVRYDLYRRPGGSRQADAEVAALDAAGIEPLLLLVGPGDAGWPAFVGAVAERYDGDGQTDAPGSPTATWLLLWREQDAAGELDSARLARLYAAAQAAAAAASDDIRCGLEIDRPETLSALLDDGANPIGQRLAFVAFRATAGTGSDGCLMAPGGLLPMARAVRAPLYDKWLYPDAICTGIAVEAGDARVHRAAVVKSQVAAAAEELVSAIWQALFDPPARPVGLLADVRLLPADGRGRTTRDAYYACATLARLLGDHLADGRATFTEEASVGNDARCFRFSLDGDEAMVAWAVDLHGEPDRTAAARLPLAPGRRYARYGWDYALTGRPAAVFEAGRNGLLATLGIDPEYFLSTDPPPGCVPLARPAPAEPVWRVSASSSSGGSRPELALDADPATAWRSDPAEAESWWRVDLATPLTATAATVVLGRLPGVSATVEVSDDGQVWRPVSKPFGSDDYAPRSVAFTGRVTSGHWRLVYSRPPGRGAALYHLLVGDKLGGGR